MSRGWARRGVVAVGLSALLFPACKNESVVADELGELSSGCLVNSDCAAPLVCAFERCHAECVTTRDCDGTLRCVGAREPERVCQLESEATCKTTADCAKGFVCGSDASCRDTCENDEQCVGEQLCIKGVCAEPDELDESGQLPQALPQRTCRLSSDCALGSRCEAGVCLPECLTDRDCGAGSSCQDGACVAPAIEGCESSEDCPTAGQQCDSGSCRCQCRADIDCGAKQRCDGCGCALVEPAECEGAGDCDLGKQCVDGTCRCACVADRDCGTGMRCDGCACEPIPPRHVVDDANLYEAADVLLMQSIVEVRGRLKLTGPYLRSTLGLESLQSVGDMEIFQVSAIPSGADGGNLFAGLSGLTRIRGNLTITTTYGFTSLKPNPSLQIDGNVLIEASQLNCEQLYELELALEQTNFSGTFQTRNNSCSGACVEGICQAG